MSQIPNIKKRKKWFYIQRIFSLIWEYGLCIAWDYQDGRERNHAWFLNKIDIKMQRENPEKSFYEIHEEFVVKLFTFSLQRSLYRQWWNKSRNSPFGSRLNSTIMRCEFSNNNKFDFMQINFIERLALLKMMLQLLTNNCITLDSSVLQRIHARFTAIKHFSSCDCCYLSFPRANMNKMGKICCYHRTENIFVNSQP